MDIVQKGIARIQADLLREHERRADALALA
jgi:hypothetical protein